MNKILCVPTFLALFMTISVKAFAKPLTVITTLPEFASIAEEIGGEKVAASALMRGNQDAHYLEPRPSMARRLRDADLLIVNGLELDAWVFSLVNVSRNSKIMYGRNGYLDVSAGIKKMEVLPPGARVDASMGHVHAAGNPHYAHDPTSGKAVARQIAERLSAWSPENAGFFKKNCDDFVSRIDKKISYWQAKIDKAGIKKIVTYHKNWGYFARTFGLTITGEMEPLPGIPPSPAHLSRLVEKMEAEDVKVVLMVNFYDTRPTSFIAGRTGARIARVPVHVGGAAEATPSHQ